MTVTDAANLNIREPMYLKQKSNCYQREIHEIKKFTKENIIVDMPLIKNYENAIGNKYCIVLNIKSNKLHKIQ